MSEDPADPESLPRSLDIQAGVCAAMASPFSSGLLAAAAADIRAGGPTAGLMARWAATPTRALLTDAVPLRLLGALHDLALSGEDPALTQAYPRPDRAGDIDGAWAAGRAAILSRAERFSRFIDHEPQTNEVRRSACLLPGFLDVAAQTGLPLRCFELGASAGLNQAWDRFHYRLGDSFVWGDPASPVMIDAEWRGAAPPAPVAATVRSRAACDRKPVDLEDVEARRRLKAYVWADQFERLDRLDAAVALTRAARTAVEAADALEWTRRRVDLVAGSATVLFHSVFWQYLLAETHSELSQGIASIGDAATPAAPFAWLRMEPEPDNLAMMTLRLTLWPGGEDRRLATVHPHGAWVEWSG